MTTTTSYGSWVNHAGIDSPSVRGMIESSLGEFWADYDIDAIEADFRAELGSCLPDGVSLNGVEFYGPYPQDAEKYRAIKTAINKVNELFWAIAELHDHGR